MGSKRQHDDQRRDKEIVIHGLCGPYEFRLKEIREFAFDELRNLLDQFLVASGV